jgi:glycosyltransferase involved in cell wall biosynthesis
MDSTLRSFYICYLSVEDPLVHTQVIAYLGGLAARGHTIHLLTFDSPMDEERQAAYARDLEQRGIAWHSLRYHKRPSLPATVYDVLVGAFVAFRLVRRYRLNTLHARNHVPAACALLVRRVARCRLIFDIRGLMAEEYVDAGRWKRGGLPYRITDRIQRAAIRRADGVVMLTEAVRRHLFGDPPSRNSTFVIPCCADLERLEAQRSARAAVRNELGLGDRPVMAYVGKFTGRYMDQEMVDFFAAARDARPGLFFLVLTQADHELIRREFVRCGIPASDFLITRAEPGELGRYLAAADFAIYFYRPSFSEVAASPTKVGEYLGAGLPVVSGAGVGDVDGLLAANRVGVLVDDFSPRGYARAIRELSALLDDPEAAERCRRAARNHLSLREVGIPRYDRLYRSVAERMSSATVGAQTE